MNKSATLAVVGGDVRQAHLAALLHAGGHEVRTFALERHPVAGCDPIGDARSGFAGAQAVILPLPVQHGDGQLNAPLSNAPHPLSDVLDAIPAGTLTLAGAVPFWLHARAVQNELHLIDYLSRDELAIRNAVPALLAKRPAGQARAQQNAPGAVVRGRAFCLLLAARSAGGGHSACPVCTNSDRILQNVLLPMLLCSFA